MLNSCSYHGQFLPDKSFPISHHSPLFLENLMLNQNCLLLTTLLRCLAVSGMRCLAVSYSLEGGSRLTLPSPVMRYLSVSPHNMTTHDPSLYHPTAYLRLERTASLFFLCLSLYSVLYTLCTSETSQ